MKKYIFTILILLSIVPSVLHAATLPAGIPERSLWFSKDPFFAGESITVHTLIYNSTAYRLDGTLTLYDGTTTIAKKDFSIEGGGASSVVSFPWLVQGGNHALSASITAKQLYFGTRPTTGPLEVVSTTGVVKRFADVDTDGDGVGNLTDTDDDNDGLSDVEDKKLRTNSLLSDTDGDGMNDKIDPQPLIKNIVEKKNIPQKELLVPETLPPEISKKITDRVPEPVLEKALPIIGHIETYRKSAYATAEDGIKRTITALDRTLQASSTAPSGKVAKSDWSFFREGALSKEVAHSPFEYVKLFTLLVWGFIIGNVYAFYLFALACIYALLRILWAIFY